VRSVILLIAHHLSNVLLREPESEPRDLRPFGDGRQPSRIVGTWSRRRPTLADAAGSPGDIHSSWMLIRRVMASSFSMNPESDVEITLTTAFCICVRFISGHRNVFGLAPLFRHTITLNPR